MTHKIIILVIAAAFLIAAIVHGEELVIVNPALVHHIAVMEGFYVKGSLPQRLHNPGALVYTGQVHAWPSRVRGFAYFFTDADGFEALRVDLLGKLKRHMSLRRAWEYL